MLARLTSQEGQVLLLAAYKQGTLRFVPSASDPAVGVPVLTLQGSKPDFAVTGPASAAAVAALPWNSFHSCRAAVWAAERFGGESKRAAVRICSR